MINLPLPGTLRWCEWRKSGMAVETWLAQEQALAAAQPPPIAPAPAPEPLPAWTQPRASQGPSQPSALPAPESGQGIWEGFDYHAGPPMPINPDLDPQDQTRSHPSGGPLSTPAPSTEMRQEGNHAQRKANPRRVRKDTDSEIAGNQWW